MSNSLPHIMIVDDSRIVRATIIKRIRDRFDVREESDGEDGWGALLVDPSIQLVITDHTMPRLDGYELIERIRSSKVSRIREMPVIMISGDDGEEARKHATELGATDFITKGIGTAELLSRLDALVMLSQSHDANAKTRTGNTIDTVTGLPQRQFLLRQTEQVLSHCRQHGGQAGILAIGLDGFDELAANQPVGNALLLKIAQTLTATVPREGCLARWGQSLFAFVRTGSDPVQMHQLAERIRQAIEAANIADRGRARLTVTIGIATCPEDGEPDAERLLAIAGHRMAAAKAAGGNCVAGAIARTELGNIMDIDEALEYIAAGRESTVKLGARGFAVRLLPLLKLIGAELDAGKAITEIERKLKLADQDRS
jgi:diguanylate cyclase (GGDEF)-like protein